MLYRYDCQKIKFNQVPVYRFVDIRIVILLILAALSSSLTIGKSRDSLESLTYEERLIIIKEHNSFSEDRLVKEISRLNFKFPHIVLAQSKLETLHYTSTIFLENNNLFGMKEAKVRLNTAQGTERSHAYYNTWQESLMDYALYAATYLKTLSTEEQYYAYLEQNYAEDPDYVKKLKKLISTQELKKVFK
jgi:hypothetical protein